MLHFERFEQMPGMDNPFGTWAWWGNPSPGPDHEKCVKVADHILLPSEDRWRRLSRFVRQTGLMNYSHNLRCVDDPGSTWRKKKKKVWEEKHVLHTKHAKYLYMKATILTDGSILRYPGKYQAVGRKLCFIFCSSKFTIDENCWDTLFSACACACARERGNIQASACASLVCDPNRLNLYLSRVCLSAKKKSKGKLRTGRRQHGQSSRYV